MSKVVMISTCYWQDNDHVMESLDEWIEKYGKPDFVFSDNGGLFTKEGIEIF